MAQQIHEVIARARNGDMQAFRQLVDMHQQFAYRVAFRLLANHDDARDVVQESFIRVWKNLPRFDDRSKFTTWLYKIVVHLCYDDLRSAYKRYKCDADCRDRSWEQLPIQEESGDADMIEHYRRLSAGLKPRQQVVFILRDLEELELGEIAAILKISVGAVKSNLYYARLNIRQKAKEMDLEL